MNDLQVLHKQKRLAEEKIAKEETEKGRRSFGNVAAAPWRR